VLYVTSFIDNDKYIDILSIISGHNVIHFYRAFSRCKTKQNTWKPVELLQNSAVKHLTAYRQLMARDFSLIATIVTTDFEAMYAYKRGDHQRCLQYCCLHRTYTRCCMLVACSVFWYYQGLLNNFWLLKSTLNAGNFIWKLFFSRLTLAISTQFTLRMCVAAEIAKKNSLKPLILGAQGRLRSSMLIALRSAYPVLVMISSRPMSVPIYNLFYAKRLDSGKKNFYGVPLITPSFEGNPLTQRREISSQKTRVIGIAPCTLKILLF